jgi:serine/threonine-protein kinase
MKADPLLGNVLEGRYQLVERIAEGAMGVVYRGERLQLGRAVAVKFLHATVADDASRRQRFEIEARAMARLDHPHCASVIDMGLHGGLPYVVMEFIPGRDLRDLLDEGALPPARAVELMRQILAGLGHAHELGITHRDVKPANIMVSQRTGLGEQVRVLDFGLARLHEQSSGLTMGMAVGTPAYMAPEQCTGGAIDPRTDLYACGILLYEMLTGDKPFKAEHPLEVLKLHMTMLPPRMDGPIGDVIDRALAKSPDDRFQSAGDFASALLAATKFSAFDVADDAPAVIDMPPRRPSLVDRIPLSRPAIYAIGSAAAIVLIGLLARCAS